MARYTRIIFGINAVYQTVLGLICLLAPAFALSAMGGTESEQEITLLLILCRMFGVNLVPAGVSSVLIAGNPDGHPILRPLMGLVSVLNLVCWGIILGSHQLHAAQIGWVILASVLQVLVLVAAIFYNPKVRAQVVTAVRRRSAA